MTAVSTTEVELEKRVRGSLRAAASLWPEVAAVAAAHGDRAFTAGRLTAWPTHATQFEVGPEAVMRRGYLLWLLLAGCGEHHASELESSAVSEPTSAARDRDADAELDAAAAPRSASGRRYDSVTHNGPPDPHWGVAGGYAGYLLLYAGDRLHFNCHVEFTAERAAILEAPSPDVVGSLRFLDEVYFGEMCLFFGSTVDGELGEPARDTSPLPAFTRLAPRPGSQTGAR